MSSWSPRKSHSKLAQKNRFNWTDMHLEVRTDDPMRLSRIDIHKGDTGESNQFTCFVNRRPFYLLTSLIKHNMNARFLSSASYFYFDMAFTLQHPGNLLLTLHLAFITPIHQKRVLNIHEL